MNESKIELVERLRASGQWPEAVRRKDERVKALRAEGMKRAEAADEAWRWLAAEYPSPAPAEPPREPPASVPAGSAPPTPCASDCAAGSSSIPDTWGDIPESAPFEAEVDWVHQNRPLVVEERPSGPSRLHWPRARSPAPSYGAVNLMEFAASNRKGFMDLLVRVKPGREEDENSPNARHEETQIAEIERMLRELDRQWEEDLVKDVPKAVQSCVNTVLRDWARRFALTIPNDARDSLGAHLARLVQDAIDGVSRQRGIISPTAALAGG